MENDLIYRQAAIAELDVGAELLRRVLDDTDVVGVEREKYEWGLGLIKSYISDMKALPSAQSEQRWISVSERLPEEEYVLISKKPTKLSGSKWCVTVAIRMADPRSGKIQWRDTGFGVIQDDKVLAWMPLPEPYEECKNG